MNLIYPLSIKGTKTSGFGYRTHPVTGKRKHHNGVDIGVPDGTTVNSVADGEVVRSDMNDYKGYGNFIIIKHSVDGETFYSAYAHLTKRLVDVGDKVTEGEKIALSGGGQGLAGGGGLSTGPHLHFEIRKSINGDWVDPEPYINGGEIVKGDITSEPKKEKIIKLEDLVVTYAGLSGKSKKIADTVTNELKNKGITNPYAIVVICAILIHKYNLLNETSFSKKLLGPNNVKIPADGAHAGQSGWASSNAWDFAAPIGSPVYAINSGKLSTWSDYGQKVLKRGGKKLYGESFTVKSDNKLPSVYYTHLSDTTVRKGDTVECGQLLGYVMDFPGSTYDHVHIGIESGNIRQFINEDGTLKCKSKVSTQDPSNDKELPNDVKNAINKLKSIYGLNITQKHIDNEFNQEGSWRPDNGGVDKVAEKKINELISDLKIKFPKVTGGIVSGYRSYSDQVTNFGQKASSRGIENTQKANTLPGFSQHHTGKAFDIFSVETSWWDKNNDVKEWVEENAKNYGFEVTYKKQGPLRIAEPWHLYYIGDKIDGKNSDKNILSEVGIDLGILIKDKDIINNFKSLDEAIEYFSNVELSDGSQVSKEIIKDKSSVFKIEPKPGDNTNINFKDLFKSLLEIPKLGAKIRKERGLDENQNLNEELERMKDLMKKIL